MSRHAPSELEDVDQTASTELIDAASTVYGSNLQGQVGSLFSVVKALATMPYPQPLSGALRAGDRLLTSEQKLLLAKLIVAHLDVFEDYCPYPKTPSRRARRIVLLHIEKLEALMKAQANVRPRGRW